MFSNTSKKQSSAQQYTEGQTVVFTATTVPELLGSLKAFKTRAHALPWMPNGSDPHVGGLLGLSKRQDNHNLHFFRGKYCVGGLDAEVMRGGGDWAVAKEALSLSRQPLTTSPLSTLFFFNHAANIQPAWEDPWNDDVSGLPNRGLCFFFYRSGG